MSDFINYFLRGRIPFKSVSSQSCEADPGHGTNAILTKTRYFTVDQMSVSNLRDHNAEFAEVTIAVLPISLGSAISSEGEYGSAAVRRSGAKILNRRMFINRRNQSAEHNH